jgi:PAS domain S-box-containing protein
MSSSPLLQSTADSTLSALLETLPDAACLLDPDGTIVNINSVFAARFGKIPQKCIGLNLYDLISSILHMPEIASLRRKQCDEALRIGKKLEFDDERGDQTLKFIINPVEPLDGHCSQLFLIIQDVTESKQREITPGIDRKRMEFALEKSHVGFWDLTLGDHTIKRTIEHSRIFGYENEYSGWSLGKFLEHVISEDRNSVETLIRKSIANKHNYAFECRIRRIDNEVRWIEAKGKFHIDERDNSAHVLGIVQDITERKQTENRLYKLNRALLAISNCNQALLRADNEMQLLNDVCHTVMEIGGYRMAWVGYAENDLQKSVRPVAIAGIEDGYLESFGISWADIEPGHGPTGTAIRTGQPSVSHNIQKDYKFKLWRSEALKRGYSSNLSLPLKKGEQVFGALTIYSAAPDAFDAEETTLLTSLADNLAYGITMLQNRKAREMVEEELRQSEVRYRSLFENKYTIMLIIDPNDGAIIDANPAAVNFYGWKRDELCSMNIKQINILSKENVQSEMQQAQNTRCNYFVFHHLRADGSVRDVEVVSVPISIAGTPLLYSIVNDITERKQAHEMLVESNNRMNYIMASTKAGLWEIGIGSNDTIWSDELWQLYGLEPHSCEPSYENWLTTIALEDRDRVRKEAEKALENGTEFSCMWRIRNADGSIRWLESKGRPSLDSEGRNQRYAGIVIDITDRKTEEEEKLQLETRLRKAQRLESIGTLTSGIAHDFKNILIPILGYSELGLLGEPTDNPSHEYFNQISLAVDRAKQLIDQILTFSKPENIVSSVVSVQSILTEALLLMRPSIPETVTLEEHIDHTCRSIKGDPSQIHRIIVNLCTNALQAMGKNEGVLRIELGEVSSDSNLRKTMPKLFSDNYLRLSISDTGTGMDEATMERIFEPFFTTKSTNKGSGLGLSVVHGIVTGYNGDITVESQPGKGTSFQIYLPVIVKQDEQAKNDKLPSNSRHILYVDDEESNTRMMSIMIKNLGYTVHTSNSPTEAITMFMQDQVKFNLVISDMLMPGMNGTDLAAELNRINPGIPIILLTGYGKEIGDKTSLNNYGISMRLNKPVRMGELKSAIKELISDRTE